jgi:hypothetical protein
MRWLIVCALVVGVAACDDDTAPSQDLAVAVDLAIADDLAAADDAAVDLGHLPCGEPLMRCCDTGAPCDPATAVCNPFGVCVSCGLYPLDCCPGGICQAQQTCLTDSTQSFCYPCGHAGQPCCFVGPGCVEAGTQCVEPDGGSPTCTS